jgi:hypothetical protein
MTLVWWRSLEILVSRFTALGTFYMKTFLLFLPFFGPLVTATPHGNFVQLDI